MSESSLLTHVQMLTREELAAAYWDLNRWKWPKGWPHKPPFWNDSTPEAHYERYGAITPVMRHIQAHLSEEELAAARPPMDYECGWFMFQWYVMKDRIRRHRTVLTHVGCLLAGLMAGLLFDGCQLVPALGETTYDHRPYAAPDQGDSITPIKRLNQIVSLINQTVLQPSNSFNHNSPETARRQE